LKFSHFNNHSRIPIAAVGVTIVYDRLLASPITILQVPFARLRTIVPERFGPEYTNLSSLIVDPGPIVTFVVEQKPGFAVDTGSNALISIDAIALCDGDHASGGKIALYSINDDFSTPDPLVSPGRAGANAQQRDGDYRRQG
jgi:hypothetical protein